MSWVCIQLCKPEENLNHLVWAVQIKALIVNSRILGLQEIDLELGLQI